MSCTNCQAATTDHLALCQRCQTTAAVALTNVSAYYADVARIQPGERLKVRGAYQSTPPPTTSPAYDGISAVLDMVENAILGWCRVLTDDRPEAGTFPTGLTARTAWLDGHLRSIATLEWAGEFVRDLLARRSCATYGHSWEVVGTYERPLRVTCGSCGLSYAIDPTPYTPDAPTDPRTPTSTPPETEETL